MADLLKEEPPHWMSRWHDVLTHRLVLYGRGRTLWLSPQQIVQLITSKSKIQPIRQGEIGSQ